MCVGGVDKAAVVTVGIVHHVSTQSSGHLTHLAISEAMQAGLHGPSGQLILN